MKSTFTPGRAAGEPPAGAVAAEPGVGHRRGRWVAAGVVAYAVQELFLFPVAVLEPAAWLLAGVVVAATARPDEQVEVAVPRAVPALAGVLAVAAAVLGACFGFIWWNAPPARIYMGDTGSLALGGVLAGLAICTKTQLLLAILGGIFVVIALSVIIQVGFFKMTGRRVFKMSPLHHHFEMIGWAETTIVIRFWLISGLCIALGLGIFYAEWLTT